MSAHLHSASTPGADRAWRLAVDLALQEHAPLGSVAVDLVRSAAGGDAEAQHTLGDRYSHGAVGTPPSQGRAAHWYHKAASQGHAPSQYALGRCLEAGVGRRRDLGAAADWYARAAAQGCPEAQCALGDLHVDGEWGELARPEALVWWRRAAAQGHVRAMCKLGWAREQGLGVEQDLFRAARWYRMAIRRGSGWAVTALTRTRQRIHTASRERRAQRDRLRYLAQRSGQSARGACNKTRRNA